MQYGVAVLVVCVAACGSSRSPSHGDAAPGIDAPLADSGLADGGPDAPADAPGDTTCPSPGSPTVVSIATPPLTTFMELGGNGSSSLAIWDVGTHRAWALFDGSGGVTHGDVPPSGSAAIYALGGRYVVQDTTALHVLAQGAWTTVPFPNDAFAVSGATALGLSGSDARIFDGTNVSGPMTFSTNSVLSVAGDGSGAFAVLTADSTVDMANVHLGLARYDGSAWQPETTIATVNDGASYFLDAAVVPFAGSWAVLVNVDDVAHVFVPNGSTWTHKQFASSGSLAFSLAANGGMLALVGNSGFAAIYKNGTWTQHALTSASPNTGYVPVVRAYAGGFVTVYGIALDVHGAVFDGTTWGSEVLFTGRSGSREVTLAEDGNAVAVGFVEDTTTALVPKVQFFRAGTWGTPTVIGSGASRWEQAPRVAAEADGIRTAYIEPGTAMAMVANAGVWSASVELPVTPTTGEVTAVAMAHAGNGRTLVAWRQVDGERSAVFAAEHDGQQWTPATRIDTDDGGATLSIAASATTFVIEWGTQTSAKVARWTPTGLGPITSVIPGAIVSDGSQFLRLRTAVYAPIYWAASADGDTWTAETPIDSTNRTLQQVVAGPAGVIAVTHTDSETVQPWLWHAGVWTTPGPVTSWWYGACDAAVGATTTAIECEPNDLSTGVTVAMGSGTAWTFASIAASDAASFRNRLSTDGTSFRIDFAATMGTMSSVFDHGTWSSPFADPGIDVPSIAQSACGRWTGIVGPQRDIVSATGTNPYALDHTPTLPMNAVLVPGPDRFDAWWTSASPTSDGQGVLNVQLGL